MTSSVTNVLHVLCSSAKPEKMKPTHQRIETTTHTLALNVEVVYQRFSKASDIIIIVQLSRCNYKGRMPGNYESQCFKISTC